VTDQYLAALNTLDELFPTIPSILYQWHITNDVKGWIRRHGGQKFHQKHVQGAQNAYQDSEEMEDFINNFYTLLDTELPKNWPPNLAHFYSKYPTITTYFEKEWAPYANRFITCWTNKYQHFGEIITSRVEGAHSTTKKWLNSSKNKELGLFKAINLAWNKAVKHYLTNIQKSSKILGKHTNSFYISVNRQIHQHALILVHDKAFLPAQKAIREAKKEHQVSNLG